jgi:plastocyanin
MNHNLFKALRMAAHAAAVSSLLWTAARAAQPQIEVKDNVGEQVTWLNKDDEPHTVVSDTGLFRSSAMDTNESFSFKFDKPGTYHFTCSIHPRMVGTIVVK